MNNIKKIIEESYRELRSINPKIKLKFSEKVSLKGDKTELDSVDIITFLTIIEKKIEKKLKKNINLLDENFFFKYKVLNIKNIIDFIKK